MLDSGWLDETTITAITPEPSEQRSVGERVVLEYGALARDERLTVRLELQVTPGFGASRSHGVELRDGTRLLARVNRTVLTYP